MIRELFSGVMLLFEPIALVLAVGVFLFSFADKKKRARRQKIAWGLLIAVMVQAVGVILITMLLSGRT